MINISLIVTKYGNSDHENIKKNLNGQKYPRKVKQI